MINVVKHNAIFQQYLQFMYKMKKRSKSSKSSLQEMQYLQFVLCSIIEFSHTYLNISLFQISGNV